MTNYPKRSVKRWLAVLLSLLMMLQASPVTMLASALAEDAAVTETATPAAQEKGGTAPIEGDIFSGVEDGTDGNDEIIFVMDDGTIGA